MVVSNVVQSLLDFLGLGPNVVLFASDQSWWRPEVDRLVVVVVLVYLQKFTDIDEPIRGISPMWRSSLVRLAEVPL